MDSNPSSPNVSELLRLAREGDAASRDALFGLCRSYLGFVARAQVETWMQCKVDASDLVQQAMMEAHRGFDQFQGNSEKEWLGWLGTIVRHNAADFVRRYRGTMKRGARREVPLRDPADTFPVGAPEPAGHDPTPSQELTRLEDELRVSLALAQLAPDHQEVIVLRNLERLPFNEVAERMGRSRPAVQMLWMRAVKKLQEVLGDEDGDSPPE